LLAFNFGADKLVCLGLLFDANLGLFEVLLVSNDVANYGGILPLLQLFFALMGAEAGGLFLVCGFQTRIASS
jgi:uncharacterized membrane protein YphA (DoxX/SURF4 family)